MYQPRHFIQDDPQQIDALVRSYPFATVVSLSEGLLTADHIPFLSERSANGQLRLKGHVARANPLWQNPGPVLAIFQGPDAYISPAWYAEKVRSGKVVPTWNYAVVHCHGPLVASEAAEDILAVVSRLTDRHESGRAPPWQVADAPAEYVERMLQAIVAIEIPVERVEAKWKVSQNRPAEDRAGVARGLAGEPGEAPAMAPWVRDTGR